MFTPRRSFLPREGLYIDPIVTGLRKTVLYPGFSIPAWCVAQKAGISSPLYTQLAQYLAIASALLWLNTYLSRQSRNNWTIDHMWNGDWTKEIVVVTGGSGGLGAGVAQRLAAMGARVVVVDIIPLTYVPGWCYLIFGWKQDAGPGTSTRRRANLRNSLCFSGNK